MLPSSGITLEVVPGWAALAVEGMFHWMGICVFICGTWCEFDTRLNID
jgi:hypothetical protein